MTSRTANFLKKFDGTGVPISLNFKGETEHRTVLGGLCGLSVMLLLVIIFISEVTQVFFELNYTSEVQVEYMTADDGHDAFMISSDDIIPAIMLKSEMHPLNEFNITSYVLPMAEYFDKKLEENGTYTYSSEAR